jgi:hypothetical protein
MLVNVDELADLSLSGITTKYFMCVRGHAID